MKEENWKQNKIGTKQRIDLKDEIQLLYIFRELRINIDTKKCLSFRCLFIQKWFHFKFDHLFSKSSMDLCQRIKKSSEFKSLANSGDENVFNDFFA